MNEEVAKKSITQLCNLLNGEELSKKIKAATSFIYPLNNITIRKVKLVKRPKVDGKPLNVTA